MAVQEFGQNEVVARASVNQRINQINNYFPVSVANGGTGANTPSGARYALGIEGRTTLYSNTSGTNSTITLSDSLGNYLYVDITYAWCFDPDYYRYVRGSERIYLFNLNVSTTAIYANLLTSNIGNSTTKASFGGKCIKLLNDTISNFGSSYTWDMFENDSISKNTLYPVYITGVYGYR